jgi:hypothetical protein
MRRTDRFAMQWRLITPGVVLVLACGIPTVTADIQAADLRQAAHAADVRTEEQLQLARELPANPPDVAVALVQFIGMGGPDADMFACLLFSPAASAELATATHASNCPAAIETLHSHVVDHGTYINAVTMPADTWSSTGDTATVNGCAATWTGLLIDAPPTPPGPLPGHLTLTRQDDKGWLITNYHGC